MRKRVFGPCLAFGLLASSSAFAGVCSVERFVGVTKEDADAVEEIVCSELHERAPYAGTHRIRVTKLGSKIVLTLVSDGEGGGRIEKQLILSGLEEVPVAAPRLALALVEQKPVAETQTVTNIVTEEARVPKKKASEVHAWMGMLAVAAPHGGTGAGAHLGFSAGSDRWSFVGDLRLAGQSFAEPAAVAITIFSLGILEPEPEAKFGYVSLSGGVRHHLMSTDTSPFLGAGVALDYIGVDDRGPDAKQIGVAGYGEIGLDLLRTHVVGGAVAFRFDAPAFVLETEQEVAVLTASEWPRKRSSMWMPVIGATFSLRF